MDFKIRLPGSTSNLGPGYDVLGLALGIYNYVTVKSGVGDGHRVSSSGEGSDELATDHTNLLFTSATTLAERVGQSLPPIEAEMEINVPLARGLGSSSTAIVGGCFIANRILGDPLTRAELLDVATDIEGHPDNVSPCLYGGFTVSAVSGDHATCVRAEPTSELKTVVVVPSFQLKTADARSALPAEVSHADATYNVGRACVVTAAMLQGDLDALASAMDDRLHQPYRAHLIPHYDAVITAAKEAGALGVTLSGAGPTLFAVARQDEAKIGEAMSEVWKSHAIESTVYPLPIDTDGTTIV